jgi:hypothetical protein
MQHLPAWPEHFRRCGITAGLAFLACYNGWPRARAEMRIDFPLAYSGDALVAPQMRVR